MKPIPRAWMLGLILVSSTVSAQTAWPEYIREFSPAPSESEVASELPPSVAALPPDASLPPALSRWSGTWNGWSCRDALCDSRVAIYNLTASGAVVDYAAASASQTINDNVEARFVGDELQMRLRTGATLSLRLRPDGDMEMSLSKPDGQPLSLGILSRGPAPYLRQVERIKTQWVENGREVQLELIIHRPRGPGPFPTIVMNHGSTGIGDRPEWFKRPWANPQLSTFFVARGWQVIYPQRRGRGRSDGLYDEGFEKDRSRYSCDATLATAGADHALADLEVAMTHTMARADVDAGRIAIGGVSRGGILATAYAGTHPEQVLGVINFVGGWVGTGCADAATVNSALFARGAAFPKASLWIYGEGDPFYSVEHSRSNFEAFRAAGGQGRFIVVRPAKGLDGHSVFLQSSLWAEVLDTYLPSVR
ncbi:alpha/beta hydrolase family protein [Cupriavidus basilensis]